MKHLQFLLAGLLLLNFATAQKSKTGNEIDSLLGIKSYFKARTVYESGMNTLSEFEKLLLGASLDNFFNLPEKSNEKINSLFTNHPEKLSDSLYFTLLTLAQINHSRLYDYQSAYETVNKILTDYPQFMNEDELADQKNTNIIWKMLAGQPAQSIERNGSTKLKMIKDKAGLKNLEVECGVNKIHFIFDTGANISTVVQSTATEMNMKIMKEEIDVTSITGLKIKCKIAICPEFRIGNILVKNSVFIVMPDDALYIPQIKYQIRGIIGFPVMEAFGEIHITQKDEFIVPETIHDDTLHNLALDFLTPIIQLNGDSYTFDTGADATMLYSSYFEKHKGEILAKNKEIDHEFGGAGGSTSQKGYQVSFQTKIGNKSVLLKKVPVLKEPLKDTENHYYGNIGQDFIRKFDGMILNFEYMYIRFD